MRDNSLSYAGIATKSRLDQATVWRVLNGRTKAAPYKTLRALASGMGVSTGWLIDTLHLGEVREEEGEGVGVGIAKTK